MACEVRRRMPGGELAVRSEEYVGEERTLTSTLAGPRQELTTGRLEWFTLKYPLLTLRVISLIHWHALLLWAKRVPWFAKAARAADQRDLYRPHSSLKPAPVPSAPSLLSVPPPPSASPGRPTPPAPPPPPSPLFLYPPLPSHCRPLHSPLYVLVHYYITYSILLVQ